jgi:uncharacterized protein YndB with AHSA1/START domain
MTVRTDDATPKRWLEVEIEVPGAPEEVWPAVATGAGLSAWFTPTEVEERPGGAVAFHMGEEVSRGVVTAFEPPVRVAFEEAGWTPGAPPLVTELVVEARAGGTCLVRLVSGLLTEKGDWDGHLDSMETGWGGYLHVLRLYLARFRGERGTMLHVTGGAAAPEERALGEIWSALGLDGARPGERRNLVDAPALSGTVERVGARELTLVTDEPAAGIALVGAYACGGPVVPFVTLYLYGERGRAAARENEAAWRAWMASRYPGPAPSGGPS